MRYGKSPHSSLVHTNGNLIAVVDVETTGLDYTKHDIWEIAILPVDSNINPSTTAKPLYLEIKPRFPENIDPGGIRKNRKRISHALVHGIDYFDAAEIVEDWFEKLELPINKKIMPMASNWPFDRDFVREFLGPKTFDYIFHGHYRDTQPFALAMNDMAAFRAETIPYPRVGLKRICRRLDIEIEDHHNALADCVASAAAYRRMLMAGLPYG